MTPTALFKKKDQPPANPNATVVVVGHERRIEDQKPPKPKKPLARRVGALLGRRQYTSVELANAEDLSHVFEDRQEQRDRELTRRKEPD